ncbi:MAG: tetratricopeptide repeat protein [Bdellovibrionales bacterium]
MTNAPLKASHCATLLAVSALLSLTACLVSTDEEYEKAMTSKFGTGAAVPAPTATPIATPRTPARHDEGGAAYDYYAKTLERAPNDGAARAAMAEILEKRGDLVGAETQIGNALVIDPRNVDWLRTRGKLQIRLGRYEEARTSFSNAVEIAPNDIRALNGLGVSLDYLGRHNAAQLIYRRALENKPGDYMSLSNLGRSLVLTGDYNGAVKALEPHSLRKDTPPILRQNLAEAYGLSGMTADAERILRVDHTRDQTLKTLTQYKTRRAALKIEPTIYVDLGHYATMALAEAKRDQIQQKTPQNLERIVLTVIPEIEKIGSTPRFALHGTGFATLPKAKTYCDRIHAIEAICVIHADKQK